MLAFHYSIQYNHDENCQDYILALPPMGAYSHIVIIINEGK